LNGFVIVTIDSPLGVAISGKKAGKKFEYHFDGNTKRGVILAIE
jgi:transcription elongation GreA/GreB family factor